MNSAGRMIASRQNPTSAGRVRYATTTFGGLICQCSGTEKNKKTASKPECRKLKVQIRSTWLIPVCEALLEFCPLFSLPPVDVTSTLTG